ncbi:MAG: rod shape-determining protein MreD [Rhodobacteraceae bacterium GWE1_64_9]|mgnify:CR=1 FL=1|nr:MAG: rod shape-determining protein MreD [Rhodobacteraceae bacterium GWE1_64_9]OHC51249.1 MAG: rod shape-determining protein MreD [Rhodobacteraceae bacterium GWF1_65_7]HBD90522.1 rod shape-determining protein MreD [Gemmobacter sp.]HBU16371.1 rod shape-determining protein MreD [Gemmobacter sp.]
MVDPLRRDILLHRGIFVAVALALIFIRLMPMGGLPGTLPGPDLLMCLILAWLLRRPDYLPALLIVAMVLLEDLLLMRPPGLWAALMLVGTEFLRSRIALTRELSFVVEWLFMAALMLAMFLGYRLILAVTFLPQVAFGYALAQVLASILFYPVVVWLSHVTLGVHKPGMGEVDEMGRRL